MSTNRETLAAALDTVPGLTGHKLEVPAPKKGDAWPLLNGIVRGPRGRTAEVSWRVIVILGGDVIQAEKMLDDLWWPVCDAVLALAVVDSATPALYTTEAGDIYAAEFIMRSE